MRNSAKQNKNLKIGNPYNELHAEIWLDLQEYRLAVVPPCLRICVAFVVFQEIVDDLHQKFAKTVILEPKKDLVKTLLF